MRMREAAEQVLFGRTLEEKLQLPPTVVDDLRPGSALATPKAPGRPPELRVKTDGVRADFPSKNRLEEHRERGKMFHFLANHELLAAELMALVLLKFPDAPSEYRAGVYEAMREEQMHTLMYLRRMKDCGIEFGQLPVNDYFWRLVSPMNSPMEFVTRLNLTFEQANLDFSSHYAKLFHEVGDHSSARVLEKIYQDEIGHVGHGVKWFRQWKQQGCSDWEAFQTYMSFPFAAAKAKGMAPFNDEGRRLAGLDEDFIAHLEVCEQSRGRTPILHGFNPFAEEEVAASLRAESFTPRKSAAAMECDLEMLMLAWSRRDDLLLMRKKPSVDHLAFLKRAGFQLPELMGYSELDGRKLGGMRPWAWSPGLSEQWQPYSQQLSPKVDWQWREPLPAEWLSKKMGVRLLEEMGEKAPAVLEEPGALRDAMLAIHAEGPALLKGLFACAGKHHLKVMPGKWDRALNWVNARIQKDGAILIEPWRERVADFSMLYEMTSHGARWVGNSVMENDERGSYRASRVAAKWTNLLDDEVASWLHRVAEVPIWMESRIPDALEGVLGDYRGPVGIDCMVYRNPDGSLDWSPVVEVNVRMSMGRVALELLRKSRPGCSGVLRIERKANVGAKELAELQTGSLQGGSVLLNDPRHAIEFLAVWRTA